MLRETTIFWQETYKAAYLVRQYFFNKLHDRLSTRPFLSLLEKNMFKQIVVELQRLYEHGGETQVAQDAPLKPSMDIFAVGRVIVFLRVSNYLNWLSFSHIVEGDMILANTLKRYFLEGVYENVDSKSLRRYQLHEEAELAMFVVEAVATIN